MLIDKSHFFDKLAIDHRAVGIEEKLYRDIETYEKQYGNKLFGRINWETINNNVNNPNYEELVKLLTDRYSPVACYVFYNHQFNSAVRASSVGDVRSTTDNANIASPLYRMRIAWNMMVDKNREIVDYFRCLDKDSELFTELSVCDMFKNGSLFHKENDYGL